MEETYKTQYYDNTMKTKSILTRFGGTFGTLRFDERSFFGALLDFTPNWESTPSNAIHADGPGVYTSEKSVNLDTKDKTQLKKDVIDGSVWME